jgi:uncharacterized membrane protein
MRSWLERVVDVVMAFMLMDVAFTSSYLVYSNGAVFYTPVAVLALALALAMMFKAFLDVPNAITTILGIFTIAVYIAYVALVLGVWNRVFSGTDEILFAYYANYLLVHGINPYTTNMDAVAQQYHLPFLTVLLPGGYANEYSYPALSFLVFTPFYLLGLRNLIAVQVLFLGIALFIAWYDTPRKWGNLAFIAFLIAPVFFTYVVGGVIDVLWIPFLLMSMREMQKGRYKWSGFWLGTADNIKQTPWISIAYLTLFFVKNRKRLGWAPLKDLLTWWFIGFLVWNISFMAYPPSIHTPFDWLRGVLYPVIAPTVSQGFALAYYNITIGTLLRSLMTLLTIAWVLFTLFIYWWYADKPQALWLAYIMPAIVYFATWRSLANYFMTFIPIAYYAVLMYAKQSGEIK